MLDKKVESKLVQLIPRYQANKAQMDSFKKIVDSDNKEVKSLMLSAKLDEFIIGDIKATCNVSEREDFIEEALIEKIKEMGIDGIIKQKEYIDMDELENAIYHGKINAANLADCQIKKEVVTLRVTQIKK